LVRKERCRSKAMTGCDRRIKKAATMLDWQDQSNHSKETTQTVFPQS